jgi:hypothetical protein
MKLLTAEQIEQLADTMRQIEELYERCDLMCNGKIPYTHWACIRRAHIKAQDASCKVMWFRPSDLQAFDSGRLSYKLEDKRNAMRQYYSKIRLDRQAGGTNDGNSI